MKNIVILGAGFGGLKTAFDLAKGLRRHGLEKEYEISLVDRNSYHTYTPTLYEIATTSKETANYVGLKNIVAFDIARLTGGSGINFIKAEIKELDLIGGDVHFANGTSLRCEYLVLALGSEPNYFGIPGLKENSLAFRTFIDALKIRDSVLELVSANENSKILIGGGGSSGVELAGEIEEWLGEIKKEPGKHTAEVVIIEGGPTVLPGFSPKVISLARKRLEKLGVVLKLNEMIEKVIAGKVMLKGGGEETFDLLIWAGGIKASPIASSLPLKIEQRGRIEVAGAMECLPQSPDLKLYGKIYGLGDLICFYDQRTGKPIPGVARAAILQAGIISKNILNEIRGIKNRAEYRPMTYPYVIPIGGKWAIAQIGPVVLRGLKGWVIKGLIELNYLLSIMPWWQAVKIWIRGLLIFIKNDRLG